MEVGGELTQCNAKKIMMLLISDIFDKTIDCLHQRSDPLLSSQICLSCVSLATTLTPTNTKNTKLFQILPFTIYIHLSYDDHLTIKLAEMCSHAYHGQHRA